MIRLGAKSIRSKNTKKMAYNGYANGMREDQEEKKSYGVNWGFSNAFAVAVVTVPMPAGEDEFM